MLEFFTRLGNFNFQFAVTNRHANMTFTWRRCGFFDGCKTRGGTDFVLYKHIELFIVVVSIQCYGSQSGCYTSNQFAANSWHVVHDGIDDVADNFLFNPTASEFVINSVTTPVPTLFC